MGIVVGIAVSAGQQTLRHSPRDPDKNQSTSVPSSLSPDQFHSSGEACFIRFSQLLHDAGRTPQTYFFVVVKAIGEGRRGLCVSLRQKA
jgi:hypothetical protein